MTIKEADEYVGQPFEECRDKLLALTSSLGFDKARIEKPGEMYTADYMTERVRIMLDDDGKVAAVKQG